MRAEHTYCGRPQVTTPRREDVTVAVHNYASETVANNKLLKALPNLQKLTLTNIGLADADLAKLKADLPRTDIKFTPASEELVAKWKQQLEKKLAQQPQPHR